MIEIIPAIDIIEGKCVRLEKGDYTKKTIYDSDPVKIAQMFESWGIKRLHLVDLDGAKANSIVNQKVLKEICRKTALIVDFGGGIKSDADIEIAFENGAAMITCGSIAVRNPEKVFTWIEKYGPEKLILGADHRKGQISVTGWQEESSVQIFDLIDKYYNAGIRKVISTDIDKDGMLMGPSVETYKDILRKFNDLYLIASGGVASISDVEILARAGLQAVIIGKAIYERRITKAEFIKYL